MTREKEELIQQMKRDFGEAMHQKEEVLKVSIDNNSRKECRNADNDWIQSARSKRGMKEKGLFGCILYDYQIVI